jgi:uncharacterized protein (TIGR02996 family)
VEEHSVQVLYEDGDTESAFYFFDDHFLKQHPGRAAFLLHEDWRLPVESGKGPFTPEEEYARDVPAGHAEGCTFFVALSYSCINDENLADMLGPVRIDKLRLPDLCPYLLAQKKARLYEDRVLRLCFEWQLLHGQLHAEARAVNGQEAGFLKAIREKPREDVHWKVYSDWLMDRDQAPAGVTVLERALNRCTRQNLEKTLGVSHSNRDPKKSLLVVSEHLAQVCLHVERWGPKLEMYHQWFFFDDLWASAHPVLANSLLHYGRTWRVLSEGV